MSEKPLIENFSEMLPRDVLGCSRDIAAMLDDLKISTETNLGDYYIVITLHNYLNTMLTNHIKNIVDNYPGVKVNVDDIHNIVISPKYIH